MDKPLSLLERAITLIGEEIETPHPVASQTQSLKIRGGLKVIFQVARSGHFPPKALRHSGIGRVIVDEWPMNSELGKIILDALSAYQSM